MLTSSRQIGQRWSLSVLRHSLKVPVGSEFMMWSGVCRGCTSPMVAAKDNKLSYDVSKSSSRCQIAK
jgi:hypothetical protein